MVVRVYRFGLFDEGGSKPRLRWFSADARMAERRLDRGEAEGLIVGWLPGTKDRYRIGPGDHELQQAQGGGAGFLYQEWVDSGG